MIMLRPRADMLLLNGMVRYHWLTGKYATLVVVCKRHNADAVRFMYPDIPQISLMLSDTPHLNEAPDLIPRLLAMRAEGYVVICNGAQLECSATWTAMPDQIHTNFGKEA